VCRACSKIGRDEILAGKSEEKRPHGRRSFTCEDNIKTNLKVRWCELDSTIIW
jgi:hypothetical protein